VPAWKEAKASFNAGFRGAVGQNEIDPKLSASGRSRLECAFLPASVLRIERQPELAETCCCRS